MLTGKLSESLRSRWRTYGVRTKASSGSNPTLAVFVIFLQELYRESVDDFFKATPSCLSGINPNHRSTEKIVSLETVRPMNVSRTNSYCYFHDSDKHDLLGCVEFGKLDKEEKKSVLKAHKLCFRC